MAVSIVLIAVYSVGLVIAALYIMADVWQVCKRDGKTILQYLEMLMDWLPVSLVWPIIATCFLIFTGCEWLYGHCKKQRQWLNKPVSEVWKKREATEPESLLRPSQDSHALLVPAKTKWEGDWKNEVE